LKEDFDPFMFMTSDFALGRDVNNSGSSAKPEDLDFHIYETYASAVTEFVPKDSDQKVWDCPSKSTGMKGFPGDCWRGNECAPNAGNCDSQWVCMNISSGTTCKDSPKRSVEFLIERRLWMTNTLGIGLTEVSASAVKTILAMWVFSVGVADVVVWIFVQTSFVQEYKRLVIVFYFLEIMTWMPITLQLLLRPKQNAWVTIVRDFLPGFLILIPFIFLGLVGRLPGCKFGQWTRSLLYLFGILLAATIVAPFTFFVNLLFFDRSTTFRPLNRVFYIIRFTHVGILVAKMWSQLEHDTVEAESPRVRCGVLGVAVKPLADGNRDILRRLMPLILPQLLLALRWRTVDVGEDESCPLSSFLIHTTLSVQDKPLVTMVYWQLFALSCDRSVDEYVIYRGVRERMLEALEQEKFAGTQYNGRFCTEALELLANQSRIYYQMRSVARLASNVVGSHSEKTATLRTALSSDDYFKRWRGSRCLAAKRKMTYVDLAGLEAKPSCCSCRWCWCCRKSFEKGEVDIVREEWEKDVVLHSHENTELDLLDPQGCPLPVCPSEAIGGIDERKSFVAHSAVAPVVFNFKMPDPDSRVRRLFALKSGDDLRQDALVLQIFRFMETAWRENGLDDVILRPYDVLPVSPQEGIVAFVPASQKVSSILAEHEGDVVKFVERFCEDTSRGFDRLCGSTAGYCVATYLLGVGDRHLDNLMITEDGHFFHIDFGFVLGEDPKPGAPPLRVPKEVIEAIKATHRYDKFKMQVGEAFTLLRKTARLWTNLLSLTRHAGGNGVNALIRNGEQGINVVRRRLLLDLDDEAAVKAMLSEVEASAYSALPVFYDKLHQVSLFWH
jgi:hypothetical protein